MWNRENGCYINNLSIVCRVEVQRIIKWNEQLKGLCLGKIVPWVKIWTLNCSVSQRGLQIFSAILRMLRIHPFWHLIFGLKLQTVGTHEISIYKKPGCILEEMSMISYLKQIYFVSNFIDTIISKGLKCGRPKVHLGVNF